METPLHAQIDKKKQFKLFAIIDGTTTLSILAYLVYSNKYDVGLIFWGVASAVLFDIVSTVNYFFRWKWLDKFERLHIWLHTLLTRFFKKGDISPKFALGLQIIFVAVVLGTLVY